MAERKTYNEGLLGVAKFGNYEEVSRLIDEDRADINTCDKNGNTPLHLASYWGHLRIVHYLVRKKAKVTSLNNDGNTPLHVACCTSRGDQRVIVQDHLTRGAKLGIVQDLLINGAKHGINWVNNAGNTPLHLACCTSMDDQLGIVQDLLSNGAKDKINWVNNAQQTPFDVACQCGHLKLAKYLAVQRAWPASYSMRLRPR